MDLGPRDEVRARAVLSLVVHGHRGDGKSFVSKTQGLSTYLMTTGSYVRKTRLAHFDWISTLHAQDPLVIHAHQLNNRAKPGLLLGRMGSDVMRCSERQLHTIGLLGVQDGREDAPRTFGPTCDCKGSYR